MAAAADSSRILTKITPLAIGALLGLGLFFRFGNLDKKFYWHDETRASIRIAGYRTAQIKEELLGRGEIGIQELQRYQRMAPERGLGATIASLAAEDPKHPPLYFLLARLWAELFGDSVAAVRSFSALMSLVAFPCLYWLCRELFRSARIAWTAIALMAVSPFHVLYAQEARPYSLWTVTILLSSAALLRAQRLPTKRNWALYGAAVALGLYTHLFFALVVMSHGIYAAWTLRKEIRVGQPEGRKRLAGYAISTPCALIAFAPWVIMIVLGLPGVQRSTAWLTEKIDPFTLSGRWATGLGRVYFDPGGVARLKATYGSDILWIQLLVLPVLFLIAYGFYFLYRKSIEARLFVLISIVGSAIPLFLPDLIFGWRISTQPRYWIPFYLAVQLSVAYLLAVQTSEPGFVKRKIWQAITVVLVAGGVVSCAMSYRAATWWNKGASHEILWLARTMNQTEKPLLVSTLDGGNLGNLIALSYIADPKVRLRIAVDRTALEMPDDETQIFLVDPPDWLRQELGLGPKAR
jgi:uncharacterized membrane protein